MPLPAWQRNYCGRIARRKPSNCSTWGLRSCPRRRYALRTPTPIRSSKRTTPLRRWAWSDALLREYARTLIEYIEYYLRFDGVQGDMVSPIIDEKLDQLGDVYYLAVYAGRKEIIGEINAYYRSLGVEEENLVDVGDKPHQVDTTLIPRKDTAQ